MTKIIGYLIAQIINVVGLIIFLPFAIIGGIFSGLSRASNLERNKQNGADIRALCAELGVPSDSYNRIVINQMDMAKGIALEIGQPGQPNHSTPWNTRLALAIAHLHNINTSSKKELLWMQKLWNWADENNIESYNIPREEDKLVNLKHLSFESISYFEREKFSTLPKEIGFLNNLVFLELGSVAHPEILLNNLTELPKEIGNLSELTHLYLQFNSLSELPIEIGKLKKLKELKLGGNNLSYIPKEIGELNQLEVLTIWGNNLKELPSEIGMLKNLKGLDISSNCLTELPNEITKLAGLKAFYYQNDGLHLSEPQKQWITMLKDNGCEIYPEEIFDDFMDDDIPF